MKRSWKTTLDEMKVEAQGKTDHVLDGYEMEPLEDGRFALDPKPEKLARMEMTQRPEPAPILLCRPTPLRMKRRGQVPVDAAVFLLVARHDEKPALSNARCLAAYLGAPQDPLIQPREGERPFVEDPTLHSANRPVHWNWVEESN